MSEVLQHCLKNMKNKVFFADLKLLKGDCRSSQNGSLHCLEKALKVSKKRYFISEAAASERVRQASRTWVLRLSPRVDIAQLEATATKKEDFNFPAVCYRGQEEEYQRR
jgi:hypothetical protein